MESGNPKKIETRQIVDGSISDCNIEDELRVNNLSLAPFTNRARQVEAPDQKINFLTPEASLNESQRPLSNEVVHENLQQV